MLSCCIGFAVHMHTLVTHAGAHPILHPTACRVDIAVEDTVTRSSSTNTMDHLKQMQPVEVSGPEGIVLHNDRNYAGLQLCHESVVCDQVFYSWLIIGKVKVGAPGVVVSCVCGLITVSGAIALHAADVSLQAAVLARAGGARPWLVHSAPLFVTS